MAKDILMKVTPDSSKNPPFVWEFSDDDGVTFQPVASAPLFNLHDGHSADVSITLEAGVEGDTVVFLEDALTVTETEVGSDEPASAVDVNPSGGGTSTINFTDDNTAFHDRDIILHLKLFATYHNHLTEEDSPVSSPDPTIVNDGTDHPNEYSSRVNTKPAAAAV